MLRQVGFFLADNLKRWIPDPFVFAILLTLIVAALAWLVVGAPPTTLLDSWYKGFWLMLEFGMQILLMLVSGYCIALSPPVSKGIDKLASLVKTPMAVYGFVVFIGGLFCLISWGWLVINAVLAKEIAKRVKGVDYAYLTACVYISGASWVCGLSSSIPLLLNTENNFLIKTKLLDSTIPIEHTLGSNINLFYAFTIIVFLPLLMVAIRPRQDNPLDYDALKIVGDTSQLSIQEESEQLKMPEKNISDTLNHDWILQTIISICGFAFIIRYFSERGFDINLEIMIFIFMMIGLLTHRTPMRYVIAMKRASSNVSGIIFQYPFYAGIMGLIMYTGLATALAESLSSMASLATFPVIAYIAGGLINFAIPSAGGEWAVLGPSFIETAKMLTAGLPAEEVTEFISTIALSVAYGESVTNLLQPFFFLIIQPVMAAGVNIQARDVMGHLVLPFCILVVFGLTTLSLF